MLTRSAGPIALALLLAGCGATTAPRAAVTAAPPPGVWYQPAQPPAARVASAEPAPYYADACADYLADEAMFLRCQWVTGPDMAQHVPLIGQGAPLADRLRCHPLRDDPPGYRACMARPS